jgi:GcrA cell cycle regulator
MSWTEERVELLRQYWAEGHSASKIAEALQVQLGWDGTRNAVIGKVHRLGLSGRAVLKRRYPSSSRPAHPWQDKRTRNGKRKIPKPPAPPSALAAILARNEPLPAPAVTDVARVALADLEAHHCRFGVGDPKHDADFGFCGADKVPGLPYCADHARRCYEAPKPRNPNSVPNYHPVPRMRHTIKNDVQMHEAAEEMLRG